MAFTIQLLAHREEMVSELASALFNQWSTMYARRNETLADVEKKVAERAVEGSIPLTMVATDGDALIGSITIKNDDFPRRSDLNPWIAGVFIAPDYRGQGYSKKLIIHAEKVAKEQFGLSSIYLYTGSADGLYTKMGYEEIEVFDAHTRPLTVMGKSL